MDWVADGIVIGIRRHGESAAIVELFTSEHGRHVGLVHGGFSRRKRGFLQIGNTLAARWRGRLSEHLGTYELEPRVERAGRVMDEGLRLAGMTAACALMSSLLPERQAHAELYDPFVVLIDAIMNEDNEVWPALFVRYELGLLAEMGYGLDLSICAATGTPDNLIYVSPRSGRAVSAGAGEAYKDRLLALPSFLCGGQNASATRADVAAGFMLTGYFLERHLLQPHNKTLPEAHARLVAQLATGLLPDTNSTMLGSLR